MYKEEVKAVKMNSFYISKEFFDLLLLTLAQYKTFWRESFFEAS